MCTRCGDPKPSIHLEAATCVHQSKESYSDPFSFFTTSPPIHTITRRYHVFAWQSSGRSQALHRRVRKIWSFSINSFSMQQCDEHTLIIISSIQKEQAICWKSQLTPSAVSSHYDARINSQRPASHMCYPCWDFRSRRSCSKDTNTWSSKLMMSRTKIF